METPLTLIVSIASCLIAFLAHKQEVAKAKKESRDAERERYDLEMRKFANNAVKEYAAERDFNHIRRELYQLRENVGVILQENESLSDLVDGLKVEVQHLKQAIRGD